MGSHAKQAHPAFLPSCRAQEAATHLNQVVQTLLAVESIVTIFGMLYLGTLMKRVFKDRAGLFSVFLAIPNGFLKQLATKTVKVTAAEEPDSDGELAADTAPPDCRDIIRTLCQLPVLDAMAVCVSGHPSKGGRMLCTVCSAHTNDRYGLW